MPTPSVEITIPDSARQGRRWQSSRCPARVARGCQVSPDPAQRASSPSPTEATPLRAH
jgi:hypothetical protein